MSTQIEIKLSNGLDIKVISILRPNDIPDTLQEIESVLYQMFEHHVEQILYQREYKIADKDIETEFNGDCLKMGMGLRGYDEDEMFATCGLTSELYIHMQEGRVKPSKQHLEVIATWLQFPLSFFVREFKYHEPSFTHICYAKDYGD